MNYIGRIQERLETYIPMWEYELYMNEYYYYWTGVNRGYYS